jgi:hypothetical protein
VQNEFEQTVAGKTVEVRDLGIAKITSKTGQAEFTVPEGEYIVRVYALGTGGPGRPFVETEVSIESGDTAVVEFLDCQTCD